MLKVVALEDKSNFKLCILFLILFYFDEMQLFCFICFVTYKAGVKTMAAHVCMSPVYRAVTGQTSATDLYL